MITPRIAEFLDRNRLGFVATVSPGGAPNVSPKGTIAAWGSDTIAFAGIRSPDTVRNLRADPRVEVSVIDPLARRGYLFSGEGRVLDGGAEFERGVEFYRGRGVQSKLSSLVLITVHGVYEVTSPLYDLGMEEEDIVKGWKARLGL